VKLIPYFEYSLCKASDPLHILHDLADSRAGAVVCRVRQSSDGQLFVCHEPTLARLCLCEERVDDLRFSEIDALLRLCGRRVLTADRLLDSYDRKTPVILHFRGFRPDANVLSRVVRDERFSFGTDSVEQLRVIAGAFPKHRTVGFASHLEAAERMAESGASVVCLYGREASVYTAEQVSVIKARCEVWTEIPRYAEMPLDSAIRTADSLGCSGVVLPVDMIR